jgi:hypothetical protein
MLGVLEGSSPDPNDDATKPWTTPPNRDYIPFLKADGLKGKRIGIPRAFYDDAATLSGENNARGEINGEQMKLMTDAIAVLPSYLVIENPQRLAFLFASTCLAADFRWTLTVCRKSVLGIHAAQHFYDNAVSRQLRPSSQSFLGCL